MEVPVRDSVKTHFLIPAGFKNGAAAPVDYSSTGAAAPLKLLCSIFRMDNSIYMDFLMLAAVIVTALFALMECTVVVAVMFAALNLSMDFLMVRAVILTAL